MEPTNQLQPLEGFDWISPISQSHQYAGPSNTMADATTADFQLQQSFHQDGEMPLEHVDSSLQQTDETVMQEEMESNNRDASISRRPRRSRNQNTHLDAHKEELRRLWLAEDKSLKEIMATMKEKHSLIETEKQYKEIFGAWGWRKNLPSEYAQWMAQKAQKRKREDDKDTIFFWKGNQWNGEDAEKRAARSRRKSAAGAGAILVETPREINYETPRNNMMSSHNAMSPPKSSKGKEKQGHHSILAEGNDDRELSLTWRGHTREELVHIFEMARSYAKSDFQKAEDNFSTALEGYGYLLGATHSETVKVAFAMASFYAEHGRTSDCDEKVEEVCRCHISKYGMEDRRTQQVILQVVEILNGWNRRDDALAFLARSKDLAIDEAEGGSTSKVERHRRGKASQTQKTTSANQLQTITQDIISSRGSAQVDYGISIARTHVAADDTAVEAFLHAIIHHCEADPETLEIQSLKARGELLKFYNKAGRSLEHREMFSSSINAAGIAIFRKTWDKMSFKSIELLEALLELSAAVLKGGIEDEAWRLFNQIEHKAEDDFGWDEERTIWGKISIGIVYQNVKGWEYAKSWFSHAYAASMASNGDADGITKALEISMEKRHFTYLSDEGRPFKTIFGVTGLTVRPTRLHIE